MTKGEKGESEKRGGVGMDVEKEEDVSVFSSLFSSKSNPKGFVFQSFYKPVTSLLLRFKAITKLVLSPYEKRISLFF
jgi:hypothetical protein